MIAKPSYYINKSNALEITEHLRRCNSQFVPPLTVRVNIDQYAIKIFDNAVRFEAMNQEKLLGLVAIYCNDEMKSLAYITSVSVNQELQGMGIASDLVDAGIEYVKSIGFKIIELTVDSKNIKAINLYRKKRFLMHENNSDVIVMRLEI